MLFKKFVQKFQFISRIESLRDLNLLLYLCSLSIFIVV